MVIGMHLERLVPGPLRSYSRKGEEKDKVREFVDRTLTALVGADEVEASRKRLGEKHLHWEQKGVPFRLEVGPRDVDSGACVRAEEPNGPREGNRVAR